jgi:hypothetical protein
LAGICCGAGLASAKVASALAGMQTPIPGSSLSGGYADAASFGFSPDATGIENQKALQRALDQSGTIVVSRPGTYKLAATVYIGSNTSLIFGNNVYVKKTTELGLYTHVLLNKGALTKVWDHNIRISGLQLIVNNVDVRNWKVFGLHGQIAFFYVKDLHIDDFRCLDLGRVQYAIQICTFEDIVVEDVHIEGGKDGIHLGRGKRFLLRDGVFETGDDAIALNAHDYSVGNPELGWIEDGVIENMRDLPNPQRQVGYFCRILAGAWIDWKPGMTVQQSDTVVSDGRLYRVQANPDGKVYRSVTQPRHKTGAMVLDGINWGVVQDDITYTAGVRNVVFRDIFLEKARPAFSIHFDNDRYSRSYYPGAKVPEQENITIEDAHVLYDAPSDFMQIWTPINVVTITNSKFRNNRIAFYGNDAMTDYGTTRISMNGCVFAAPGSLELLANKVPNKKVSFKTQGSIETSDNFSASVVAGDGSITVESDLPGLRN